MGGKGSGRKSDPKAEQKRLAGRINADKNRKRRAVLDEGMKKLGPAQMQRIWEETARKGGKSK